MYPPIYAIAAADPEVTAVIGSPPRLYLAGHAMQNGTRPYATWQTIYGAPENTLSCVPDTDLWGVQVDAWGGKLGMSSSEGATQARNVAKALRDAFEPHGYIVAWNGEDWEQATGLYRVSFTVEFWTDR